MNYSTNGLELTKKFEGCVLKAYQDVANVWTIGYGHTDGVEAGQTCTQAQADAWLLADVQTAVSAVTKAVVVPLTQNQFDALVDFTFNLGEGALRKSTLLKLLNTKNYQSAAVQFPLWNHANGRENADLTARRLAEQTLFNSNG